MAGLGAKSSGTWRSSKLGVAKEHQPPMWKTGWWGAERGGGGSRLSRATDQKTASSVPFLRRTHVSVSAMRTFGANWLSHTTRGSVYNAVAVFLSCSNRDSDSWIYGVFLQCLSCAWPWARCGRQSVMAQSCRSHCHKGPRHTGGAMGPLCDGV